LVKCSSRMERMINLLVFGLCLVISTNGLKEIWIGTAYFCAGEPKDCYDKGMDFIREDKYGDGKKCVTGVKVLCREKPNAWPQLWIGTSLFCTGKPKDCNLFDMDYIRSDSSGDGKTCATGTKVLCKSRLPKQTPDNAKNTDANQLTLISYNIYGRPFSISHDGQNERSCHIPRALVDAHPETDVVVISEGFTPGCFPDDVTLRQLFKFYGFPYSTTTVGDSTSSALTFINGGVYIVSRWPIVTEKSVIFKHYTTWEADRFSRKGVMYAKINKNGQFYHVFGTHLQAQESAENDRVRVQQAGEFKTFSESLNMSPTDRVIYAGDLNAEWINNPTHVQDIANALDAVLIPKSSSSHPYTEDGMINNIAEKKTNQFWLDYIMYPKKHQAPKNPTMTSLVLLTDKPFDMCFSATLQPHYVFPDSDFCEKSKSSRHLSDHFPVKSTLRY